MDFEQIWKTYERELSAYVLSRVGDKEVQKDLMQEIALKIFTSLQLQKEHLRGWLYTLTKNVINDHYRKHNKPLPELEEETEVEEHLLLECLSPMINALKTEEKEILELSQIQQYSLLDIASMKDLPLNTVKSKLFRAKKSLARNFFSCCEYEKNARGEVVDFVSKDGCGC
jgi:RNA polymerase sigma-70 factor (ECF subfamily)